jgi:hypothetical protein
VSCTIVAVAASVWLAAGTEAEPASFAEPHPVAPWPATPERAKPLRDDALRRARVWRPSDVAAFDFGANPADSTDELSGEVVNCRFLSEAVGGTTPKFTCVLPDGDLVKVKYGRSAEIPAEAAATRLLTGLGFGADRIYILPRLRCFGCPPLPFHVSRVLGFVRADNVPEFLGPDTRVAEYEWVAVERRMEGRPIGVDGKAGWAWFELGADADPRCDGRRDRRVPPDGELSCTGTTADNQRPFARRDGRLDQPCPRPFAIIRDPVRASVTQGGPRRLCRTPV